MRTRKDYKLPPQPAHLSDVGRPENLVLNFLGPTGVLTQTVDLSDHRGRPRLMAELAFALRYHLADKSRGTRGAVRKHLRRFLEFLDQHDPSRVEVMSTLDVGSGTLRAYIAWLDGRPMTKAGRVNLWTKLKVALAWLQRHRPDLVQPGLELPYNPFPRGNLDKRPRPALARKEIEAVLAACRQDIDGSWADFQRGRELIAEANARIDPLDDGAKLDLSDLGVLLAVVAQRHAGLLPEYRALIAGDALCRKMRYAVTAHGGAERLSRFLHTTPDSIMSYMIAIGAQLFANPEALRTMRRGCMSEDLLLERRVHVTFDKGRAGRVQRRSFLRDRSMSVPNLIDRVLALTAPLVPHAAPEDRDKLFLVVIRQNSHHVGLVPSTSRPMHRFAARHGLLDRRGKPLCLTLASLRPTGLTLAHAALGHDLTKTQALANHADPAQTKHYVSQPMIQAEQTAGLARLQGRFVEAVRGGGRLAKPNARADETPEAEIDARNATASGFVCSDPLSGIAPGQRRGRLCTAWLGCFTCPNAVIPLEAETLARLLRVRAALAEARAGMALDRWRLLYAPKLEVIERDILPRFPAGLHAAASAMVDRVPAPPPIE